MEVRGIIEHRYVELEKIRKKKVEYKRKLRQYLGMSNNSKKEAIKSLFSHFDEHMRDSSQKWRT